jgi:inner membrane protein
MGTARSRDVGAAQQIVAADAPASISSTCVRRVRRAAELQSLDGRGFMATPMSHAVVALAMGTAMLPSAAAPIVWIAGAACSAIPDLDVLAFRVGIPYEHLFGHRGFTHSLAFAALLATVVTAVLQLAQAPVVNRSRLWAFLFAATASHGFLDALTNGGHGIAFFAPFSSGRYFFPVRPIVVSPIGRAFFSDRGLHVLVSEAVWLWLPSLLFVVGVALYRRSAAANEPAV